MERLPQIVAFGGGGFSMEAGNPLLDDHVLSVTGVQRPKVCFLPTASGDADHYVVRFYQAFGPERCSPSHLSLFRRDRAQPKDPAAHLLAQDVIYVGGGCVRSMIGTWKAHGLDQVLAEAHARGVVLCGLSAGSLCWFDSALTAYHGEPAAVEGLGLLPFSNCVHYDTEPERQEAFRERTASGELPEGYAADDGAALHFVGHELHEVVTSRPGAGAYRVNASGETRLETRYLGEPALAVAA